MAEFEMTRAQLDAQRTIIDDVHQLLVEAYELWVPGMVAATLGLSQSQTDTTGVPVADLFWSDVGQPTVLMMEATLRTLREWPEKLDQVWDTYQAADTASAETFFPVPTDGG